LGLKGFVVVVVVVVVVEVVPNSGKVETL